MAREMKISGMDEISRMLEKLGAEAGAVAARALYTGAGIVADAVSAEIEALETQPFYFATEKNPRKCSPEEKAALTDGVGIAPFDRSGAEVVTAVSLKDAGYVHVRGYAEKAGKDIALPLLARSINSGTTFRVKQPFFRHAVNKAKGRASSAIAAEVEKAVNDIMR